MQNKSNYSIFIMLSIKTRKYCHMNKTLLLVLVAILISFNSYSQRGSHVKLIDTSMNINVLSVHYGFGFPSGDLSERFGPSHQIGGSFLFKSATGWNLELEGNFIFKDKINNPDSILSGISTPDGVIDMLGTLSNIMLTERGFTAFVKAGKLVPIPKINPNSGIMFQIGAGFMQHKIRIDVPNNNVPQLDGDYKKGYDHLCNGPAVVEYVGLHYQGNNQRINFKIGIESVQAYTQNRRVYYFNDMKYADEKRFDMLTSIKVGWMLPFYPKTKTEYYYY